MSDIVPFQREMVPTGEVAMTKLAPPAVIALNDPAGLLEMACPRPGLSDHVNEWRTRNLPNYLPSWEEVCAAGRVSALTVIGSLYLQHVTADGEIHDLGLVSHRQVTKAAIDKMVDGLRASDVTTFQSWKWHAIGTGTNAEAVGNTDLQTEQGANYATPSQRAAGSQVLGTGSSSTAVYRTVGIVTVGTLGSSLSITEHGVFSAQTSGSGTLLDRTMFSGSPISLNSNESIQATYDLTLTGGG